MKKLTLIISLLVIATMLLTACQPAAPATEQPQAPEQPTEQPKPEEPTPQQPAAEKPAEPMPAAGAAINKEACQGANLKFLTIQPHNVAAQNLQTWFQEASGAQVELIVVPYDNVIEKAVLDVTSGANEIDVVEYWYPGLGTLVENNVLENLDQWYADNASWIKADDFFPTYFDTFTKIGDSRYGIPYDGDMHLLWYYKPLFEKYSLQPPKTWDEYLNACKTITEGEKGNAYGCAIMGAKIPLILIGTYLNRLGSYGGSFFDAQGKPTINSPEAVAALEGLVEQSKYALPTASAVAFDEALGGWFTGKVGMVEFWTDLGSMTNDPASSKIGGQWGVVPLPKGPGDKGKVVASVNAGFAIGVSTGSKNKACAMEFVKFVADPETAKRYNTVVGGIDPARQSTLEDPKFIEFVGKEVADAIREAHKNAVVWPTSALWFKLQEPLNDNLSLALSGQKTPQQALDDTQKAWEDLLK
ncbi:MAG: extracellular solute-binding protein [Anaerolineae bacterium]|nr:extracellular solute-binding protein [Anaerolineae bacterium]